MAERGRPKLPAASKRSELVACKLTPGERRRLERAARAAGQSVSTYVRRVVMGAALPKNPKGDPAFRLRDPKGDP